MKRLAIVLLVLALLAFAACKPGGDQGLETGTTDGDQNAAAGDQPSDIKVDTKSDVKTSLKTIFDKMETMEYKVAYDITNTFQGKIQTSKLTQYVKGEKIRMDASSTTGGQTYDSQTYITNEQIIACTNQQGAWQCMKIEVPENQQPDISEKYKEEGEKFWQNYEVAGAPDRKLAGVTAKCFTVTFTEKQVGTIDEEVCYAPEGVPLYISTKTPEGTTVMSATSYKTSVSASDFVPPAEPQDVASLMAQYGIDPSKYQ